MSRAYLVHESYDETWKERKVNTFFCWKDETWLIPSVFLSDSELAVDFCVEVDTERICRFIEKWDLLHEADQHFTREESEQIESEHPLQLHMHPELTVNGRLLKRCSGSGESWIPASCLKEGMTADPDAASILKRYGLDPEKGWSFWRSRFHLENEQIKEITSLELKLIPDLIPVCSTHFSDVKEGETVRFLNPVTDQEHMLAVKSVEAHTLTKEQFRDDLFEYPLHFVCMKFRVEPQLDRNQFSVWDCCEGDRPRYKESGPSGSRRCGAASVAVLGGAKDYMQSGLHTATSSLYFEPVDRVDWRLVFHVKNREEILVKLI